MKLVTPEQVGFYSGVISSVFALANLLGPVLGGVIADHTVSGLRCKPPSGNVLIYTIDCRPGGGYFGSSKPGCPLKSRPLTPSSAPIIGTSFTLLFFAMPSTKDGKSIRDRFRGFDSVGSILSICWPVPLLFALQEAGVQYEWKSGVIIGTLVTGIALFLLFGLYETVISIKTTIDAIFPIRFLTNPALALMLLSMFFFGMSSYVVFIQLPQRFQGVNFKSAERAGILLLPVSLLTPVGAMISGVLFGKKIMGKSVPLEYVLLSSLGIISLGVGLLSSLPVDSHLSGATYGYEIIIGFGIGLANPPYFPLLSTCVEEKDVAIGIGIMNMLRTLGGAVAVAVCSALHHSILKNNLAGFLNTEEISAVEKSVAFITQLPEEKREMLGRVFGKSYNRQFQVTLGFSLFGCLVVIAMIVVRKKQGIFGWVPERKEENEFMKKAADGEKGTKAKVEEKSPTREHGSSTTDQTGEISGMPPIEGGGKHMTR
jgi:hypothetical protein